MKKIILLIIVVLGYINIDAQSLYCLKVIKENETNTSVDITFEITSPNTQFNVLDYSFILSPNTGITGPLFFAGLGPSLPLMTPTERIAPTVHYIKTSGVISFTIILAEVTEPNLINPRFPIDRELDPDCSDISNIQSLLPLEWLSFKANPINTPTGIKVALDWSTASEKDVKNFEVERSEDGKVFKKIGEPLPASNTVGNHSYSALDEKPLSGISYYRIRQTDFDDKFSLSKIQSVNLSNQKSKGKFTFFPNPIHKGTPLSILTDVQGEYSFKVIDLTGRLVYNAKLQGNAELENLKLAGGTYLYQILSNDQSLLGKIFVAE